MLSTSSVLSVLTKFSTRLNQFSTISTVYWQTETIICSWELGLFQQLEVSKSLTITELSGKINSGLDSTKILTEALDQLGIVSLIDQEVALTELGKLFVSNDVLNPINILLFWRDEQNLVWRSLKDAIESGKEQFSSLYGISLFEWYQSKPEKLKVYYSALHIYAILDYYNINSVYNFSENSIITDVGGGFGGLLQLIHCSNKNNRLVLFDLPLTIKISQELNYHSGLEYVSGSFFEDHIPKSDIIILARVLHDWEDEKAQNILKNCLDSLNPEGKLLIIERLSDDNRYNPFLQLNQLVLVGGKERTYAEYLRLINSTDLRISETYSLNNEIKILECVRNN